MLKTGPSPNLSDVAEFLGTAAATRSYFCSRKFRVQEIPHHSSFSKNRHGRFQESKLISWRKKGLSKQAIGTYS